MLPLKASRVFVAGGQPSLTYVNRDSTTSEETLEQSIRDYLEAGHKALTVTGPTKSGKTVLCRTVLSKEDAVWISGGNVATEEDFWAQINDALGAPTQETANLQTTESMNVGGEIHAKGGLPLIAEAGSKGSMSKATGSVASKSATKNHNPKTNALKHLNNAEMPLVIDDFHYIDRTIQRGIVRALKDAIFDGQRVVLIAVPHRAFDAVRSEREMTGRVDQISVDLWSDEDLRTIATQGFPALNVICPAEILSSFIKESQGSPHLMQEFCRRLCEQSSVREAVQVEQTLTLDDPNEFFRKIALSTAKPAFDMLARGPRQRSDRKQRKFNDESSGDIYLAVLRAIAHSGAKSRLTYEDIRSSLRAVLAGEIPQAHEIGRVLVHMTAIAKDKIEGEAVLEWDEEETVLHVADPFFAFYLRWIPNQPVE